MFSIYRFQRRLKTDNTLFDIFEPLVSLLINKTKHLLLEDHPMNFPTKSGSNWHIGFREED